MVWPHNLIALDEQPARITIASWSACPLTLKVSGQ